MYQWLAVAPATWYNIHTTAIKEIPILNRANRNRTAQQKKKRLKKIRQGKNIPFTIANFPKAIGGITNSYVYKVNVHHCSFANAKFYSVRYRSGHITQSSFKGASLISVDFICVNLKRSKFKGTHFTNCLFFGCDFENADFKNSTFTNTYFIRCSLKNAKNLNAPNGLQIITHYPKLELSNTFETTLYLMSQNSKLEKYSILTINKNKNNHWLLNLLLNKYTEKELIYFFKKMLSTNNVQFYTFHDYILSLSNYYKK